MSEVFIGAARRTPIGRLSGALAEKSAAELGSEAVVSAMRDLDLDPGAVDDVIIGQVLSGGAGQNPARQTAVFSGLPVSTPAMTINQVCGAGMRSVHLASLAIRAGEADIVVAGGQDSMSRAPHVLYDARRPSKPGTHRLQDSMVVDGLWDAFHDVHMGTTAEHLAQKFQITRDEQDAFAAESHRKALTGWEKNVFDGQIAEVSVESGATHRVGRDEGPRDDLTPEKLSRLRPVFDPDGSITAGNSSGINDGAAAMIVGSERGLKDHGIEPMARVASFASVALEPMDMGLGPVHASRLALDRAGWRLSDVDVFELNEAFAAQAIAVNRELGCDLDKVNPNGGAIALGHPLAGSGARIVVAVIHELIRTGARRGLASLCIGGGQGTAICVER